MPILKVTACSNCPCYHVDVDIRGVHNDHHCTMLDDSMYHAWDECTAPNCPLRQEPIVIYLQTSKG